MGNGMDNDPERSSYIDFELQRAQFEAADSLSAINERQRKAEMAPAGPGFVASLLSLVFGVVARRRAARAAERDRIHRGLPKPKRYEHGEAPWHGKWKDPQ